MLSPLYIALGNHINRRIEGISTEASQVSLKVVLYFPPVFHPSLNFYCIMGMNDIRLGAVCITPLSLRSACRWIDEHREMENLTGKTEYKRNTLLEGGGWKISLRRFRRLLQEQDCSQNYRVTRKCFLSKRNLACSEERPAKEVKGVCFLVTDPIVTPTSWVAFVYKLCMNEQVLFTALPVHETRLLVVS